MFIDAMWSRTNGLFPTKVPVTAISFLCEEGGKTRLWSGEFDFEIHKPLIEVLAEVEQKYRALRNY